MSRSRIEPDTFPGLTYHLAIATDGGQAVADVAADRGEIRRAAPLHARLGPSTWIALIPTDQAGAAEG